MSPLASTSAARGPSVAMTEGVTQPIASPCAERGALPGRRGELREVGSGSLCVGRPRGEPAASHRVFDRASAVELLPRLAFVWSAPPPIP